jgi:hypothetical protein
MTQSSKSWEGGVSEIVGPAQDTKRLAPDAIELQAEVERLRKEIDELKHRLEFLLEQTGSARGNTNKNLCYYGCIFIGCSETFDNKND